MIKQTSILSVFLFSILFGIYSDLSATGFKFGFDSGYIDALFTKEVRLYESMESALKEPDNTVAVQLSASCKNLAEIKNLKKLKYLILDKTFVSDGFYLNKEALEAFFKVCDELPELEFISINDSRLMSFVKSPQKIKGLKINKYEWNTFQNTIHKFNNLEILIIEDQDLTSIPNTVGTISTLKQIELKTVSLPQLPDLSMLQSLIVFKAELGKIIKLHPSFAALKNIKYLSITGMVKFDEFPKEIYSIENLEELHIELRNANPITDEIGNLSNLKILYLIDCQNISKLPEGISRLKHLEYIYLSDAKSSIDISPMGKLESQFAIMLVRCNYSGLAKQLETMKNLKHLIIPSGTLPNEIKKIEKYISKEKITIQVI